MTFIGFSGVQELIKEFEISESELDGAEIILAYYSYEDYSGEAFVLFRQVGHYYEVNASHCSCFGLEGQWNPEQTTLEAIVHRLEHGDLGRHYSWRSDEKGANKFAEELEEAIINLEHH